ncbi:carbamoyltransferase family protein [Ruegeria sp.]|uniref:carbamoyltransferase family protein n=1 Tax=Ruegeria sp. TaxID=1879320 RepID=UPI003C79D279
MAIIGISCFYHDAAAACVGSNGSVLAAAQEERFTRKRHDPSFPSRALEYCVSQAAAHGESIEKVVFYENPFLKFDRIVETALRLTSDGKEEFDEAMSRWLGGHLFQHREIEERINGIVADFDCKSNLIFVEHHAAHASSAFFPSPFDRAAILTLDGVGEHATASLALGEANKISMLKEMKYPNSLGLLYSAFTHFTGFKINSGEYKMMGLAPYGDPIFENQIRDELISVNNDGSFEINQEYFQGFSRNDVVAEKLERLFGVPRRESDSLLTKMYADVAASIQRVVEDIVQKLSTAALSELGCSSICLAGGVALNSVANGRLAQRIGAGNLWIQPAAGDAGGALGAALYGHHVVQGKERKPDSQTDGMSGAYLGPAFDDDDTRERLTAMGASFTELSMQKLRETVASELSRGSSVAWFQGRMEFGPRALGNRSILADPRSRVMQRKLNLQVKKRESFRPFAPAVLEEFTEEWFQFDGFSPYMSLVAQVNEEHCRKESGNKDGTDQSQDILPETDHSQIPAVTHVDYSARVQTVSKKTNPEFHALIDEFRGLTDCPILVNTSFNVRGEPIVCTPEDAFRCFVNTDLDYLAIGPFLVRKTEQDPIVCFRYFQKFEHD